MDVRSPGSSVVTNFCDDLARPDGLAFFHANLPDVSVGNRHVFTALFEDNQAGLGVPVHRARCVGRIGPRDPDHRGLERRQNVAAPAKPVLILFPASSVSVSAGNSVASDSGDRKIASQLVDQPELRTVRVLTGPEREAICSCINRRMDEDRLGEGVVFEVQSGLGRSCLRPKPNAEEPEGKSKAQEGRTSVIQVHTHGQERGPPNVTNASFRCRRNVGGPRSGLGRGLRQDAVCDQDRPYQRNHDLNAGQKERRAKPVGFDRRAESDGCVGRVVSHEFSGIECTVHEGPRSRQPAISRVVPKASVGDRNIRTSVASVCEGILNPLMNRDGPERASARSVFIFTEDDERSPGRRLQNGIRPARP